MNIIAYHHAFDTFDPLPWSHLGGCGQINGRLHASLVYLTPVKTQLLQNTLSRDLMLFYHSNKIKA